jgi:hypothetical protein
VASSVCHGVYLALPRCALRESVTAMMMKWKFFIGAAILAIGLLGPYAPLSDVLGGIALAAVIHWKLPLSAWAAKFSRDG